ncbi:hypothetical protein ISN44_As10g010260 [Arabidopsis suecica]|uniref:Uncharacterized protein n=1 Tax=Arabidopsis suecica TaxID=45249 RepID=A0A8T1ZXP6_ARASU|nr:hypothetical protein ISN44_As10g010260 [Arabidopsis suecica]
MIQEANIGGGISGVVGYLTITKSENWSFGLCLVVGFRSLTSLGLLDQDRRNTGIVSELMSKGKHFILIRNPLKILAWGN